MSKKSDTQMLAEALEAFESGVPTLCAEEIIRLQQKLSIDQRVHAWLQLPDHKRVVVTIDNKATGAHRGRRSCVACKGGLTEENQVSVPMKLGVNHSGEKRDMYCYVLVCSSTCELDLKNGRWFQKA